MNNTDFLLLPNLHKRALFLHQIAATPILLNTFEWVKTSVLVLPLDQAGWHMSDQLEVPEGIHLVPLPPYFPELQLAERLWPLVDEPLANEAFETIAEVEELVIQRCRRLLVQQQLIQGLTFYHWWLQVVQAA